MAQVDVMDLIRRNNHVDLNAALGTRSRQRQATNNVGKGILEAGGFKTFFDSLCV
jgi:hypothetical protein